MDSKTIQDQIKPILEVIKKESFVAGFQATDEMAMGLFVSKFFEWDGVAILETSFEALQDANFHTEAGLVNDMLSKYEVDVI